MAADGSVATLHTGPGLPTGFAYALKGDEVTVYNVLVVDGAYLPVYLVTRVTSARGFITVRADIAGTLRAGRLATVPGVCGDSTESRLAAGPAGTRGTPAPVDLVPGHPY